jgi:cob(I)alamin adenosyltransferase
MNPAGIKQTLPAAKLLSAIHSFGSGVIPLTAQYLNRLSDLLFVLARVANKTVGDVLWVPGANR